MEKENRENPESGCESSMRNWADLTDVCLVNVFSRLPNEDRWKSTMFVCKSWLEATQDRSLFCKFDLETVFERVKPDRSAWWEPEFEKRIDRMVRSVAEWSDGLLLELLVRHCSDHALSVVADRCPNVQVLSIRSCPNVTDVSLSKIAFSCSLLRELDISYCYEISYKSLELIGQKCPNLKVLKRNHMNWLDPSQHLGIVPSEYLNALPQDGDREASMIALSMKNLEHLELRFSKMSANGLTLIAEGCVNLEYFDLFGCANLTGRAMEQASTKLKKLATLVKPNFYIPRPLFNMERYGHWRLYDERFQTNAFFQI
ncbi:F-box protein SKIP1-like [Aristolochia californica]|uniref:F-box protein SKIP1-like n=1 Tax=Aristolochia californica TaxID=171875 RepID=UPI0035D6A387